MAVTDNYLYETLLGKGYGTVPTKPVQNTGGGNPLLSMLDALASRAGMANQAPDTMATKQRLAEIEALVAQQEALKAQNPVPTVAPTDTKVAAPIQDTPVQNTQPPVQANPVRTSVPRSPMAQAPQQASVQQMPQVDPVMARTQNMGLPSPVQQNPQEALMKQLLGGLSGGAIGGAMGQQQPAAQPQPHMQQAPQQSFMQRAGQTLMGALPGIIEQIQFNKLSKPQGGVVDGMTGLTFGATDPMQNPAFLQLIRNQEAQRTARDNEQKFAQEMAYEEFKRMLDREDAVFESDIKINEEEAKRFGETSMELLKNDMMDRSKFDPVIWNAATKDRDAEAMNIVATWIRPDAKKELEGYARDLHMYKKENPDYQFSEQDKDVISILGLARTPNSAYARETALISADNASQNRLYEKAVQDGYNTRQKGISLANSLELARQKGQIGTKPGQKPTTSKEAQSSPENPVNINAGGVTYSLQGVDNPVIVYEKGFLPRTIEWNEYKGIQPKASTDASSKPKDDTWGTKLSNLWTRMTGGNDAPAEAGTITTDGTEDLSLLDTGGY
jgi:hypothetical protein